MLLIRWISEPCSHMCVRKGYQVSGSPRLIFAGTSAHTCAKLSSCAWLSVDW